MYIEVQLGNSEMEYIYKWVEYLEIGDLINKLIEKSSLLVVFLVIVAQRSYSVG